MLLSDFYCPVHLFFVPHLASATTHSYHVSEIHFQLEDLGLFVCSLFDNSLSLSNVVGGSFNPFSC